MSINTECAIDLGIIIAFIAVLLSGISVFFAYKKQRISLVHDLVLIRFATYKQIKEETRRKRGERIGNFFEYLSILIKEEAIPKKICKKLFRNDLQIFFEKYPEVIQKNKSWKEIFFLKKMWKIKITKSKKK